MSVVEKYKAVFEKVQGVSLVDIDLIERDMLGTKTYNVEMTFLFTSKLNKIEQSFSCFWNFENDDLEFEAHPSKKKLNLSYKQVAYLYNLVKGVSVNIIVESEEHESV